MFTRSTPSENLVHPAEPSVTPAPAQSDHSRLLLVCAVLALGAATVAAMIILRPVPRNDLSYVSLAPVRDSVFWWSLVDGVAFAATAVALAIAVSVCTPRRGRVLALIGAPMAAVAGVIFACALVSIAAVGWHATAPAVPRAVGIQILDGLQETVVPFALLPIGFLTYTLGSLILLGAVWRAGVIARPWLIIFGALTLMQFSPGPRSILDVIQVLINGCLVAFAIHIYSHASHRS